MSNIFAVALNLHDHNTYDGVWHNQRERETRFKHNLPYHAEAYAHQSDILNPADYRLNDEFVKEYFKKTDGILAFTYTYGGIRMCRDLLPKDVFDYEPKSLWDFYLKDNIYYIDHHQSHATYAFLNSGFEQSDILAIDGIGSKYRCVFFDKEQKMIDLSDKLPIGWLWNHMSNLTGLGTLGASKLMGKVGYGQHSDYYYNLFEIILDGPITEKKQKKFQHIKLDNINDLAYTLQEFTIDKIKEFVYPLKSCDNLCIAGGVAYNGYMNEEFTKHSNNVYIPPAVLEEHYKEYFDTNSPSPYMSRICKVKTDKVPGITHVDNTARIQTVNKNFNGKFYNLINEFYKITGVPMLLNTSFNRQEPIVETPEHALRTFKRTALDLLVINDWIIKK